MAIVPEARARPATQVQLERQIRLRHLRVLLAFDDRGGVTRAAEHLGVTQAAISKAIAEIEAMIGTPVLERQGRNVTLTQAGMFTLSTARRIATEVRVLAENLDLLREGAIGMVSIGIQAVSTQFMLARAIGELKRQWPRATVNLVDGLMPDLLRDLRGGRLDLVIGRIEPKVMNPDLEGFTMVFDPTVIIASPNHPALPRLPLSWAEAVQEAWCLPPPGTPMRDHFDQMIHVMGLEQPTNVVQCGSLAQGLVILQEIPSFGFSPLGLAEHWSKFGTIATTNLVLPSLTSPIGLIWSKTLPLGPTARMFRQIVMQRQEGEPHRQFGPRAVNTFLGIGTDTLTEADDTGRSGG